MKTTLLFSVSVIFVTTHGYSQKVFLNPSNQTGNPVAGGGNEAQYALINANNAAEVLRRMGFEVIVDQDFTNAPYHANSWGADVFVSVHSNAGGGHGTETLYKTEGGKVLAQAVQNGLLSFLPYQSRGLKQRNDLYVLNTTRMYACLAEVVFHDCTAESGYQGHPPSESSFLRSSEGQKKIGNGLAVGTCRYFRDNCTIPTTGFFKGVVYIAPDKNQRIEGAVVTLNTGQTFISTTTGYFEFEVPPGTYTATAHKEGFYDNSSTRTVVTGQEVWGSIGLTPIVASDEMGAEMEKDAEVSEDGGVEAEEVIIVEEAAVIGEDETSAEDGVWVWSPPQRPEKVEVFEDVSAVAVPEEPCPRCICSGGCGAGAQAFMSSWLSFAFIASLLFLGTRQRRQNKG